MKKKKILSVINEYIDKHKEKQKGALTFYYDSYIIEFLEDIKKSISVEKSNKIVFLLRDYKGTMVFHGYIENISYGYKQDINGTFFELKGDGYETLKVDCYNKYILKYGLFETGEKEYTVPNVRINKITKSSCDKNGKIHIEVSSNQLPTESITK